MNRNQWTMLALCLATAGCVHHSWSKDTPLGVSFDGDVTAEMAPIAERLKAEFFDCYPKLLGRFENPKVAAPRQIRITFVSGMAAPARTLHDHVEVSVEYLAQNPNDMGMLTHELTHSVQDYPSGDPSWLIEGIADYSRSIYGPTDQGDWHLPSHFEATDRYTDSYRTSARFLVCVETRFPGTVDKLHRHLQNGEYEETDFKAITGSSLDVLWADCVRSVNGTP